MTSNSIYKNVRLETVRDNLDKLSPTMCLAKWLQSTVVLYNGQVHACHHNPRHNISVEQIKDDPSYLHNTDTIKDHRKKMLHGERPEECNYCWKVEDLKTGAFSDRIIKSGAEWAQSRAFDVFDADYTKNIFPSYLEVAFDYTCNFKCAYCSPSISSTWMAEIEQFGPYFDDVPDHNIKELVSNKLMPIPHNKDNPYIDAFWKWWPDLYKHLHVFRLTGGEPLLSKHTWEIFEYIKNNENPNFSFYINSNFDVPSNIIDKFIENCNQISEKVKSIILFVSFESTKERCEYVRYGINYDRFIGNIIKAMNTVPTLKLSVMSTVNVLSITDTTSFLTEYLKLKSEFHERMVSSLPAFLRYPQYLSIRILPDYMKQQYTQLLNDYLKNNRLGIFEFTALRRIIEYMNTQEPNAQDLQKRFHLFTDEYDRRKNLNFLKVFPEFREFKNNIIDSFYKK